ncbi:AAA family ATPase, partial [Flavobacterium sp.]|uniref:AAA family ATPase n=1 Tax=Flavobacterium sp. TaxID=239 RepID=UPI00374DEC1B
EKTNPVIHFSFDSISYKEVGLADALLFELKKWANKYEVSFEGKDIKTQFLELLQKVSEKHGQVVLLIDEYDKPIIDFLEFQENGIYVQSKKNQEIMKSFYSILKSSSQYLRFFLVTGVSKFSKVSIFSDLNNLTDLTLHPEYSTLTGYTQTELETYFDQYIEEASKKLKLSRAELLQLIKTWYDGFSWDGVNRVYNPYGVLNFLDQCRFTNFWFSSGTPTFLLHLMKRYNLYDVENSITNSIKLEKYTIENLELVPLLFQTGYLTVKSMNNVTDDMVLDYPNKEVRESMYFFMIDGLTNAHQSHHYAYDSLKVLLEAFQNAELDKVKTVINNLLSGLPSETYDAKSEGLYHGLLHFIFKLLGTYIKSEVHSSKGRADSIVETPTHVFIFEFKFNRTGKEALNQIIKNNYAEPYRASGKIITGIGVNFNTKEKSIKHWVTAKF